MHTGLILQLDNFSPLTLTLQNRSEIPFHQNIYSCLQFHSYLTKLCPHVVFLSDHLQLSHFRSGPSPGGWRLLWILLIVQSLGAKILNTLGSQETCQKWRDPFFKKSRPHDSRFLTAPLCSRSGSQSRQNKELAKPANLYTILNLHTYAGAVQSPTVCYHCGICSGACTFPTAGVTAPSSQPPALLAGHGKSARLSPWLYPSLLLLPPFPCLPQKWTDLLSIWERIPSLWQHRGTPILLFYTPFFLFFSPCYFELRLSAWTGLLLLTLSVSLPFFTLVPARFFGQLSRNVAVTEDQKWSNCVIA